MPGGVIAYCGLNCGSCPIHLATQEQDTAAREKMRIMIAGICSEQYGLELRPDEINDCDGCRADSGRIFSACRNCRIRQCARERKLESCAYCGDYGCGLLMKIFNDDPSAQTRLEELRKNFIP